MAEEIRPAARPRISNELIGMLAIGVALAGLILATSNDLRAEIRHQVTELRTEIRGAIDRLDDRLGAVETRLGAANAQGASAGQSADARERTVALGMAQSGGPGADVRTDGIRADALP